MSSEGDPYTPEPGGGATRDSRRPGFDRPGSTVVPADTFRSGVNYSAIEKELIARPGPSRKAIDPKQISRPGAGLSALPYDPRTHRGPVPVRVNRAELTRGPTSSSTLQPVEWYVVEERVLTRGVDESEWKWFCWAAYRNYEIRSPAPTSLRKALYSKAAMGDRGAAGLLAYIQKLDAKSGG